MTTQTTLQFISDGFKAILESSGVQSLVQSVGETIKNSANANAGLEDSDGFTCKVWKGNYGGGRWVASVTTTDKKSMKAEAEDKALSRAIRC